MRKGRLVIAIGFGLGGEMTRTLFALSADKTFWFSGNEVIRNRPFCCLLIKLERKEEVFDRLRSCEETLPFDQIEFSC
jgi:hypothetical protein